MSEPKQITYVGHKDRLITIHDIYQITDDPEEAGFYLILPSGTCGMKLARRGIVK